MTRFACPKCSAIMSVPDNASGKRGRCPKCGQLLEVPFLPEKRSMVGIIMPPSNSSPRKEAHEATWHDSPPIRKPTPEDVDASSPNYSDRPAAETRLAVIARSRRLASPTFLVGAVVLFFLPWVDIRCSAENGKTIATQSGVQMIVGHYTFATGWEGQRTNESERARQKFGKEANSYAPLLAVYLLLVFVAMVAACTPAGRSVSLALTIASLFVLLAHLPFGLPAQRDMGMFDRELAKEKIAVGLWEAHLTVWFWLTVACLVGAVVSNGVELGLRFGTHRREPLYRDGSDEQTQEPVFSGTPEINDEGLPDPSPTSAVLGASILGIDDEPPRTPAGTKIAAGTLAVLVVAIVVIGVAIAIKAERAKKNVSQKNNHPQMVPTNRARSIVHPQRP